MDFERTNGRPPRVLHIGNIANNAYNNAKLLRAAGVDCDVICYDYYHLMGNPEWEDADFKGTIKDQFFPDWSSVDLQGFKRPAWFAQGTIRSCYSYLMARRRGARWRARLWWQVMALERLALARRNTLLFRMALPLVEAGKVVGRYLSRERIIWIIRSRFTTAQYRAHLLRWHMVWHVRRFAYRARYLRWKINSRLRRSARGGARVARKAIRRATATSLWVTASVSLAIFGFVLSMTGAHTAATRAWTTSGLCLAIAAALQVLKRARGLPVVRSAVRKVRTMARQFRHKVARMARMCATVTWRVVTTPFWLIGGVARIFGVGLLMRLLVEPVRWRIERAADEALAERLRFDARVTELVSAFGEMFPDRPDQLGPDDLGMYRAITPTWRSLLAQYDVVQAYATDPILPLLAGKRPYVAFEHGTLRTFTLCPEAICRNTAIGYRLADHVFVTNGDCLDYANRLGISQFSPMLHPFDELRIREVQGDKVGMRKRLGVERVFLCTLRHDWAIKGTDLYVRALPRLANDIGRDFRVLMTKWGAQLDDSLRLAAELGVADLIHWIEPLHRHDLFRTLKSVDVVFDQIALPHFGATAPEAIAAGVPVIMSYDPRSTEWIVPEPAPILSAWTVDEIAEGVRCALDPIWLEDYTHRSRDWIARYHNSRVVVDGHLRVYAQLLGYPCDTRELPATLSMLEPDGIHV